MKTTTEPELLVLSVVVAEQVPSNESILEALSIQQARSLQNLIHNNLKNSSKESLLESIKVIIDVYTIYVNNNHPISSLVFNEIAKYYLFENILKELGDVYTGNENKTRDQSNNSLYST